MLSAPALLDGGAPYYRTYLCSDGRFVAVGAIGARFAGRPRDKWAEVFLDTDACVTPVLELQEVPGHPHIRARGTIVTLDGVLQAAPTARFSLSSRLFPQTGAPAIASPREPD